MNDQTVKVRDLVEQNVDKVIDRIKAASIIVKADLGGTGFTNMLEVIESAKMMAMAGPMVPEWLRGNPGGCWGVILQAIEWRFSPLSVARMSFEVNGNIGYMAQLVHAVIEARAPIQGRLRCDYEGEGGERVCVVSGTFKGDFEPQIYRSPKIKDIKPKNSPLWTNDPDQQLWYFSSRSWCRRYAPDVLMGVYSKDDLLDNPAIAEASESARDVGLHARLVGSVKPEEGHRDGHAASELDQIAPGRDGVVVEGAAAPGPTEQLDDKPPKPAKAKRTAAKDKPKAIEPPKPEPAAPPATESLETVKTADQYRAYALAWIASATSAESAKAQWSAERKKRNDVALIEEMFVEVSGAYQAKLAALASEVGKAADARA